MQNPCNFGTMSILPVSRFRHRPPSGRLTDGMSKAIRNLWNSRQQDSTDEARDSLVRWNDYFAGYREQTITTPEGEFIVMVKDSGDAGTNGGAPWQTSLLGGSVLRIYPSGIWDGKGHSVWASYQGVPSIAGGFFDLDLPSGDHGFVYLECEVDDTDDYHGILNTASIKASSDNEIQFLQRLGSQVKIPLVEYFRRAETVTLDPLRSFLFVLRRYGPPSSITWDVEPL